MATLKIKNLSDRLYRRLQARAALHGRSLAQEATDILERALTEPELHSLLELRGLGKEAWKGVDPASHVAEERGSWD
ncbi:MAG: hypothetical protein R3E12_18430 [Candidatus Eisenbacteria bacterium]